MWLGYELDDGRIVARFPAWAGESFLLRNAETGYGAQTAFFQFVVGISPRG
jgi:hypothetical protein